jgi:hypothetical protein
VNILRLEIGMAGPLRYLVLREEDSAGGLSQNRFGPRMNTNK